MTDTPPVAETSRGARIAGIVLACASLFLWMPLTATMTGLGNSDPAGNAMSAGFAGLGIILLWILLTILALLAATKGTMPQWARTVIILVPLSGVAAMFALELLARPSRAPGLLPIIVPLFVPPLVVFYTLWALLRPLTMTASHAAVFLGAIAALSAAVVPMSTVRTTAIKVEEKADANERAALDALPADAPLWEFMPFLNAKDQRIVSEAYARIAKLERRHRDAQTMLERGDLPLARLTWLGLDMTPAICETGRAELRRRVEPLVLAAPGTKPYSAVASDVRDAMSAMYWLVGYGCAVDAESLAWENMAKAYRDPGYDLKLIAGMREPDRLGKTLREDPARFSQLNAQSHLKAWLKFSDAAETRDQVIAGVRKLEDRTAQAVAFLNDRFQESSHFRLMRILPFIDLEATPALCAAVTKEVGPKIKGVYRPGAGDTPLFYYDLLSRLGVGRPLTVLVWLAEHGCDVSAELREAEISVRAYQDSPGRAAMLAALARLQKN